MKQIFLLLMLLSSRAAQAQSKPAEESKQVLVGINFSPDYNFRKLRNNDGSASSDLVINNRNDKETGKFGFTTGLNICIQYTKLVGLEAGIQYSNKGYQTKKQDQVYFPPDPALPTKAKFIYNYQYIDVPLKVNFTIGNGKLRFLSSAGFATNIFIKEKQASIFEYANGKTEKKKQGTTANYKKINISPMISLGLDHKINDQIHFRAEPIFRYGVLKIIDTPVTACLWSAGLNMGFYYALK